MSLITPEDVDGLKISLREHKFALDVSLLEVSLLGRIDTYNSSAFTAQVKRLINQGYPNILLNTLQIDYMSSTGIGSFIEILKAINIKKGYLVVVEPPKKVFEVFMLLGFNSFFIWSETPLDGLKGFQLYLNQQAGSEISPRIEASHVKPTFPLILSCAGCQGKLKAPCPGQFRCRKCQTVIKIGLLGEVKYFKP